MYYLCFSWGCDHEKQAIAQYVEAVSPQHVNFETKESGLVINPSYPHFGASPDAFMSCDCCGSGTLEIKCPYCVKTESPENAVEMLTYLETDGDDVHLKETETYFYQIQAQLNICEVEYGDFVVWTVMLNVSVYKGNSSLKQLGRLRISINTIFYLNCWVSGTQSNQCYQAPRALCPLTVQLH